MAKKIKVLQIVGSSKFGGASIVVLDVMSALSRNDLDVRVLREEMGRNAKKRIYESFNDIKIANFLHDFYIEKINDKRSR